MPALTTGYRGKSGSWTGVAKLDGKVVVECGHGHTNRDQGSRNSAVECVRSLLIAATQSQDGGPYCSLRRLHGEAGEARATMLRRGVGKASADEAVAVRHAHIDQTVARLRAEIAAGATVPARY